MSAYDAAVIGAGVFGASIANRLAHEGRRVLLLDAYGPGNSRSSSGGESRIIRMGYGADEIYTRMAQRSLVLWKQLFERIGRPLFQRTGVLWLAREGDPRVGQTEEVLARCGVPFETLSQAELRVRYPQMCFESVARGVFEPESGALLARRAVQALIDDAPQIEYRHEAVAPLRERDVRTISGDPIKAGIYIFACGAWLPKLFPGLLSGRIFPTRQEVFFFGTPPGDTRYSPPAMPCWIEPGDLYGIPDLEARGFKIACDRHGEPIDPETQERLVTTLNVMRARMASLFPGLKDAPLVESRVCQYENTSSGHFLIDRHPDFNDIWLVGGGSGHGFKHGPAVGEYVASQINGLVSKQTRFQFDTKTTTPNRIVY